MRVDIYTHIAYMARKPNSERNPSALRSLREIVGLSQKEFATLHGVPYRTLQFQESNGTVSDNLAHRLGTAYGVESSSLHGVGAVRMITGDTATKELVDAWRDIVEPISAGSQSVIGHAMRNLGVTLESAKRSGKLASFTVALSRFIEREIDALELRDEVEKTARSVEEEPIQKCSVKTVNQYLLGGGEFHKKEVFARWKTKANRLQLHDMCEVRISRRNEYLPLVTTGTIAQPGKAAQPVFSVGGSRRDTVTLEIRCGRVRFKESWTESQFSNVIKQTSEKKPRSRRKSA